ncbi:hypothetical protein GH714_040231 [Hevea brasiliensis]|uniref:Uncharacterized protein n=1 Tax=Hevea brasiliensis TaxID=3981 RepID=A0A6A6MPD1_HEVBR|nr:hypothetical protein GH714_040231 [Hevea brasiliensis]
MVRGELPFQRCRVAFNSVEFSDRVSGEELASNFADIIIQMAQDLTMPREYQASQSCNDSHNMYEYYFTYGGSALQVVMIILART